MAVSNALVELPLSNEIRQLPRAGRTLAIGPWNQHDFFGSFLGKKTLDHEPPAVGHAYYPPMLAVESFMCVLFSQCDIRVFPVPINRNHSES